MSTRITSHILNGAKVATPLKINMEPQIEGLVQMIFLFKPVNFSASKAANFPGWPLAEKLSTYFLTVDMFYLHFWGGNTFFWKKKTIQKQHLGARPPLRANDPRKELTQNHGPSLRRNFQPGVFSWEDVIVCNIWVFPKIGIPQIVHFNRVFHHKPSILGYPYFWKHPYICELYAYMTHDCETLWDDWMYRSVDTWVIITYKHIINTIRTEQYTHIIEM